MTARVSQPPYQTPNPDDQIPKRSGSWVLGLGIFAFLCAPVLAHHGFDTEYDAKKKVKLEGVVTQVAWTNPHMRVYIDVTGPDGKVVESRGSLLSIRKAGSTTYLFEEGKEEVEAEGRPDPSR